jgi:hypothetical protein
MLCYGIDETQYHLSESAPSPPRHPAENLQLAVPAPQAPTRHPAGVKPYDRLCR